MILSIVGGLLLATGFIYQHVINPGDKTVGQLDIFCGNGVRRIVFPARAALNSVRSGVARH